MKRSIPYQINIDFKQIVQLVKQLSPDDKIRLSKEIEQDLTEKKLSRLLSSFKTDDISEETILEECNLVREELYKRSNG